jgi:hypothetical protein
VAFERPVGFEAQIKLTIKSSVRQLDLLDKFLEEFVDDFLNDLLVSLNNVL